MSISNNDFKKIFKRIEAAEPETLGGSMVQYLVPKSVSIFCLYDESYSVFANTSKSQKNSLILIEANLNQNELKSTKQPAAYDG